MTELLMYTLGIASGWIIYQLYDSYKRWRMFKNLVKILEDIQKNEDNDGR